MRLYALLSERKVTEEELDAHFLMGSMLQQIDDMSDVSEDRHLGITTLANSNLISPTQVWEMKERTFKAFEALAQRGIIDSMKLKTLRQNIEVFILKGASSFNSSTTDRKDSNFKKHILSIKFALRDFLKQYFPLLEME